MAGSKRFEIDLGVNASGAVKGANDAAMAFADLEDAVGDVADESRKSGNTVDSFAKKLVAAAREAGKSDDEIRAALRGYGVNAKDAERAIGRVGDEFKDAGRDGKRSLNDLEDELRDVQRQSEKLGKSVDDFDVRGRKAFGGLSDGAKEVTQEVGQNLGEAVSSVRGDLSDLGQVGQDTLGGLAATLAGTGGAGGILGAAALAAGATGLGLVTAEIQKQNEKVQALRDYFADAWKAAIDGGRDYIDTATIASQISEIALKDSDERTHAQEVSKRTGLDLQLIYRALAGDLSSMEQVNAALAKSEDDYWKAFKEAADGKSKLTQEQIDNYRDEHNSVAALAGDLDRVKTTYDETRESAKIAAQAISDQLLAAVDSADSATRAVDDFGNVLITLPTGQEIVIDAKTGQATSDVSKFKKDTDGVIQQLNGSDINLVVKAALKQAQDDINRFVAAADGKSFTLRGRVKVDSGWDQ